MYAGSVRVAAVDEKGRNQVDTLQVGDIWYFPKGQAHTIQGLDEENEYLLAFDDGNFDATGTTFNVDDWITHTPKSILAKNFGVDESIFDTVPQKDPYIAKGNVSKPDIDSPFGKLEGNSSYVYKLSQKDVPPAPGGGGTLAIVDSTNFPIATTIAAAVVNLEPGGLRELHWHPNVSPSHPSSSSLQVTTVTIFSRPKNGSTSIKAPRGPLYFLVAPLRAPLTFPRATPPCSRTTAVTTSKIPRRRRG